MLNFLGVAGHLPDERSRQILIGAAAAQGKDLIEKLRLHIYREDEVLFALAHNLISTEEFDRMDAS